jgi:hypothetical protein
MHIAAGDNTVVVGVVVVLRGTCISPSSFLSEQTVPTEHSSTAPASPSFASSYSSSTLSSHSKLCLPSMPSLS